jgi:hypothetical protein
MSGEKSAESLASETARLIRIPAVETTAGGGGYGDFSTTVFDESALTEAEARVLDDPTKTSRSFVGLVLRSLIHYKKFDRAMAWMNESHHLPHAADNLGRYVSAATEHDLWANIAVEDWFVDSNGSGWPHLDWVAAQHALAVPSHKLKEPGTRVLRGWLAESASIQRLAVAVQRLATLDPVATRVAITSRLDNTGDPLLIRLLALGLVAAEGSKDVARSALARHDQNFLTLKFLETKDWKLPKPAADFDPADTSAE